MLTLLDLWLQERIRVLRLLLDARTEGDDSEYMFEDVGTHYWAWSSQLGDYQRVGVWRLYAAR